MDSLERFARYALAGFVALFLWALCVALALLLGGCGGGAGAGLQGPGGITVPEPSEVSWTRQPTVAGEVCCNYAPIVVRGHTLLVYSNSERPTPVGPGSDGDYWLRSGTLVGVGAPRRVLHIDNLAETYIRTSGVAVDSDGKFAALLHTGDGYPTTNGYSMSWATSPDGERWTWHGNVSPVGRTSSSSNALIVNSERRDDYRYMTWLDGVGGRQLTMLHSADGLKWTVEPVEVVPASLRGDSVNFTSAARTPYGYHLIYANNWPSTHHRHLWSCDGRSWRVLESNAPTRVEKGTNLAYDAGTVYAHVRGDLWTFPARAFAC